MLEKRSVDSSNHARNTKKAETTSCVSRRRWKRNDASLIRLLALLVVVVKMKHPKTTRLWRRARRHNHRLVPHEAAAPAARKCSNSPFDGKTASIYIINSSSSNQLVKIAPCRMMMMTM
jgi:hypothetical protein